jgi:hypothetical protein
MHRTVALSMLKVFESTSFPDKQNVVQTAESGLLMLRLGGL